MIDEFEDEKFHLPPHTHKYYEIIYIKKCNGIHHLNNNLLPHKSGDLYLISPEDKHYINIKKSTRFFTLSLPITILIRNKT
ncbi:AraC family ligand binding domain-containing protein [Flavobacterium sp. W22_SRS_FK3]|uniref:AraC family ligand binding domain-containing protein n=1 Tax=Flavobacterium sp. W22_SRS_FK3 TaxID=3240275 RepID=UPI003F939A4B